VKPADFRRQIAAARRGDTLTLKMLRSREARSVVFNERAPELDRMLAAAASDFTPPATIEQRINESPALQQAALSLVGAQTGDVTIGQVAGRDVVTINVYVGSEAPHVE
jgi:hypothetical protein